MNKNSQYKLSASLICANLMHLEKEVKLIEKSKIDYIHFDIMDGIFVPRFGLFPEIIIQIRKFSKIPIDIHMMIVDAEKYLDTFLPKNVLQKDDLLVFHAESTQHIDRVIRKIKEKGVKVGIALNPGTSLHVLDYLLPQLDLVMLMAINPGIVGHKLIPEMIDKVKELKSKLSNYPNIIIEVDGGVNLSSAPKMLDAGANMLVCGTQTIFQPPSTILNKTRELRKVLDSR